MALDITALDLIVDETTGLQDNDTNVSNDTVTYLLGLDSAGGLSTPQVAFQANFVTASANAGETINSIVLTQNLDGDAFSTTDGVISDIRTVDGNYVWLFQDANNANVVIGVIGTSDAGEMPDPTGPLAFSFALLTTSSSDLTADLYTVQYVPLFHPDDTEHDDQIDLTDQVFASVSGTTTVSFTGQNAAPGNHDFYLLNSPTDASKQLLVVGFVGTTNATANVSTQGFGVGNQSINAAITSGQSTTPAEVLQVDFVTGGDLNAGSYSQIQYDNHIETIMQAGFTINQITPSTPTKRVDIAIAAYNVTGEEKGTDFSNGSPTTAVDITSIKLTGQSGYADVITADGTYLTASGNITVSGLSGTGNVVTITGLDNVTVVDITTAAPLDRLTVTSVDANEGLDITEFHFTSETPNARVEEVGSYINFDDDGPTAAIAATGDSAITDESTTAAADDSGGGATYNDEAGALAALVAGETQIGYDVEDLVDTSGSAYGSDGAGTTEVTLEVNPLDNDSGLDTTSGDNILLFKEGDIVVGRAVDENGVAVFAIAIDDDGNVTVDQYRSIAHSPETTPDQIASLASGVLFARVMVTDGDDDTDSQDLDIGPNIGFEDDGPTVSLELTGATVTIDESVGTDAGDPNADDEADQGDPAVIGYAQVTGAVLFDDTGSAVGEDEEGATTAYTLDITGQPPANTLEVSDTDADITLVQIDPQTIEGQYDDGVDPNAVAFRVHIDETSGDVTFTQYAALEHGDPTLSDEPLNLAGLISAVLTTTDGDGDVDSASVDLGAKLIVEDDGPTVALALTDDEVRIDESVGLDAGDPNAFDEDGQPAGVIGYAQVAGAVLFDDSGSDAGEDGEGASSAYTLAITAQPDPDTLEVSDTDEDITLVQNGTQTIEGWYDSDDADPDLDALAFSVHIDSDDGDVTFTQYAALEHGDATDNDDSLNLAGLISAVLTTTDGDGDEDSASVDLGAKLIVEDDGPNVTGVAVEVDVDDDGDGAPEGNPDGDGDIDAPQQVTGDVIPIFDAGSDGLASFTMAIANFTVDDPAPVLYSQGALVEYDQTSNLLTGYVDTDGSGDYDEALDREVFTFALVSATGAFTFTQIDQIDHPDTTTEDNLDIELGILLQAIDNDGDSSDAAAPIQLTIHANDDSPVVNTANDTANDATGDNDTITTDGATGDFDYAIGFDDRDFYDADNTDLLVSFTGGTVFTGGAGTAIQNFSIVWGPAAGSETDASASFSFTFDYQADPGSSALTSNGGTLVFDKVAGTYTFTLDDPISSYGIISTATASGFVGYLPDTATIDTSQPFVTVAALATDFFVQFTGRYEAGGGTDGNNTLPKNNNLDAFDLDGLDENGDPIPVENWSNTSSATSHDDDVFSTGELFTQTSNWVSISGTAAGVAGDTMQAGEVLDFNFYQTNPEGDLTPPDAVATTGTMFIEFDALDNGEDLVLVLKLVDKDDPSITTTRVVVAQFDDIFHIAQSGEIPASFLQVGAIDQNDGMVIIESNDYNINAGDNWTIAGAQVIASTEGLSSNSTTIVNLNRAVGDSGGSSFYVTDPFSAIKDSGNNTGGTWDGDVFKIVNIGFLTEITPDSQFNFDVEVIDFDGDSSGVQSLTIDVTGEVTNAAALPKGATSSVTFQEAGSDWASVDMAMDLSRLAHIA